jgi:hypothetical protein
MLYAHFMAAVFLFLTISPLLLGFHSRSLYHMRIILHSARTHTIFRVPLCATTREWCAVASLIALCVVVGENFSHREQAARALVVIISAALLANGV